MADETPEIGGDEVKAEKPKASSGKSPLLTLLVLLNTGVVLGVAYMQYQAHQREAARLTVMDIAKADTENKIEGDVAPAREEDGILFPLETFTANLAQGDGPRRFLRLNAVLKFSKSSSEEEFKARKPQIRDVIIRTLNSKRPDDLLKIEGKNYLKEEIKAAINSFMVDSSVIDVFYVGFQIN